MTRTFKSRAKPDSPRAATRSKSNAFGDVMIGLFCDHDELTVEKVVKLLGDIADADVLESMGDITLSRVQHRLARMRSEGAIHSWYVFENERRIAIYALGPDESKPEKEMKPRTVSKWKPSKPDPFALPMAFFGQSASPSAA